ncbi:MAG: hypothetical protein ACJAYU_001211 [Bradymonadia bacterium]|jgi:hypothetical protein
MQYRLCLLGLFSFTLFACGTDAASSDPNAEVIDLGTDDTIDVGADATIGSDAGAEEDTSPDSADVGPDAAADVGPADADPEDVGPADVGQEDAAREDAEPDSVDAEPDSPDVGVDADADSAVSDTGDDADTEPDVAPDVEQDTIADTDPDSDASDSGGPDAEPDVAEDTPPDVPPLPDDGVCGLVTNPGAEDGLAGWTVTRGSFVTVEGSGFAGTPDAYEGDSSFAAGDSGSSELAQTLEVSEWAADIDAGGVQFTLSAQVRTWSGDDEAALAFRTFDAAELLLSESSGGPWTRDSWTARSVTGELPVGTRTIDITLQGTRNVGSDNDAYFDAVSGCVGGETPAPALRAEPYLMWVTHEAVSVRWESSESSVGTLELDLPDGSTEEWSETEAGTTHEIRIEGLAPQTTYGYRLTWPGGSSETSSFRTAPEPGVSAPFSFVVWGDNQNGPDMFSTISDEMLELDPSFAFSTGDCVQNGTRGEYRSQLFGPMDPFARQVPYLVAAGNHERYSDSGAALFDEYMSQPADEHCFGWSYGDFFMVFIDSELSIDEGSDQRACIVAALESEAATSATFRGAAFHKPPRIDFWFGGVLTFIREMEAPWIRESLEPLLESLDVDVVFNGHNHLYAYTPETDGGITWFTTGGAGGSIDTDSFLWRVGDWPEIALQIHDHHFLYVQVLDGVMTVSAISDSGAVLDTQRVLADLD